MSADLLRPTSTRWKDAAGGDMIVGYIPIAGKEKDQKISRTFDFDESSRTLIAAAQIVSDALILSTLSYVSFRVVIYPYHGTGSIQYLPYFVSTIGTIIIMIFGFAHSGVYDVFDEFKRVGILRTVKCVLTGFLLLTACLFILKVSDTVSRLWLATWGITSVIALCGFRLLTASAARKLRQSGRLMKNVAIVAASEVGQQLAEKFIQARLGTRMIGIFDERQSRFVKSGQTATTVHPLSKLSEHLRRGHVDEIVIAIPPHAPDRILELLRRFHPRMQTKS